MRKTYSQLYRHTAAEAVAAAFANLPHEPIKTLSTERASKLIAVQERMNPPKSSLEKFKDNLIEAANENGEPSEDKEDQREIQNREVAN